MLDIHRNLLKHRISFIFTLFITEFTSFETNAYQAILGYEQPDIKK